MVLQEIVDELDKLRDGLEAKLNVHALLQNASNFLHEALAPTEKGEDVPAEPDAETVTEPVQEA